MNVPKNSSSGVLHEKNGFLIPVIEGDSFEMGRQYGSLMVEHMKAAWDVLIAPGVKSGSISDADIAKWARRGYSTGTTRTRSWYDGVAEGTGWTVDKVCFLDQMMEFGIFQAKLHSFAGCTSILSWASQSVDGNMYIGRNMDWSETFNKFPQVLTVRKPSDGSYKIATLAWPGMSGAFTGLNEHGVYLDVHDGTSMGGSVVYEDRPSILSALTDMLSDASTLEGLIARLNGINVSTSTILSIGDNTSGASMECSSLGGNRLRKPEGDSCVVVNTFLGDTWGLGKRETVSHSLRRYQNMTDRLGEHVGSVDAKVTRDLMDMRLFNEDGSLVENGGCTKPTTQDADQTTHQMVTDVSRGRVWLKVPSPKYFADWTEVDLKALWA